MAQEKRTDTRNEKLRTHHKHEEKGLSNKMYPSEWFTLENAEIGERTHLSTRHTLFCCCCCRRCRLRARRRCLANVMLCNTVLYVWMELNFVIRIFNALLAKRNSLTGLPYTTFFMSTVRILYTHVWVYLCCLLELITCRKSGDLAH